MQFTHYSPAPPLFRLRRLFALVLLACVLAITSCTRTTAPTPESSAYDRVMSTGVIRAAYLNYPPAAMKDTVTGEMSGIFVEALERAADNLGLEVEWTEEVGWGSQIEGLNAGRYDIIGSPVWANATRGKLATMTRPIYYSGIGVYVRADDERLISLSADDLTPINMPEIRIATIDGETADLIARTQFPDASRVSLPQLADISQKFLSVSGRQADVLFAEPYFAREYARNNPQVQFKNLVEDKPLRVFGNCYMFARNEFQLKHALDVAMEDLINSGYIDELLLKYEGGDTFYKVAAPYQPK